MSINRQANLDHDLIAFVLAVCLICQYRTIDVAPHDVSFYCRRVMIHISLASNNHGGLTDSTAGLNTGLIMNRYYKDGQTSLDHGVFDLVLAVCLVCQYQTRHSASHNNRYRPVDYHNYDY